MSGFDQASMSAAWSRPGADSRQWISYGTVLKETPDTKSVVYDDGKKAPPSVLTKLHPSGTEVPCRVASFVAGNGEGEWSPFIEGDEVIIAIPQGSETSGCVIIGRLNNEIDTFPTSVAGQDTSDNSFAFRRIRTPYILETASSYLVRGATSKSFLSLAAQGDITLSNSDGAFLALHADMLTLQNGDADALIQIDTTTKQINIEAQGTKLVLSPDGDSLLLTGGPLYIGTSGGLPVQHAVTFEQLAVILQALLTSFGAISPGPMIGSVVAGASIPLVNAAIALATTLPVAPLQAALTAALSILPDPTFTKPGAGVAGLRIG